MFFRTPNQFVGATSGAGPGTSIDVSADGLHLYMASPAGLTVPSDAVAVYARNGATGALTFVERETASTANPRSVAVSPDGDHVYLASGSAFGKVTAFDRAMPSGLLSFIEEELDGGGGVDGLANARSLAISPDGAHVYVAANGAPLGEEDAVTVFSRNAVNGQLTFVEAQFDNVGAVEGLEDPVAVVVSPDGDHVYVAARDTNGTANPGGSVVAFSRNPANGQLTFVEALYDTDVGGTIPLLTGPESLVISPDGGSVYVGAELGGNLVWLGRTPSTGELYFAGHVGPSGLLAMSSDGEHLYILRDSDLYEFRLHPATGTLRLVESYRNGLGGISGLVATPGLGAISVSPDGRHVYAGGGPEEAIAVLRRDVGLRAFNTVTRSLLTQAAVATEAAVAGERAVLLTSEAVVGDVNGNNDGDALDEVAQLYDAAGGADTVIPLVSAANQVAISDSLVALTLWEYDEGNPPVPRNFDGDVWDSVLAVFEIGTAPPPQFVGVAAGWWELAVTGNTVVFLGVEIFEDPSGIGCSPVPGGCDLNGDGDAVDAVIRLYDHTLPPPGLVEVGQAATEFVAEETLVAFRTSEASQASGDPLLDDLNSDGDLTDSVMQVYDLATNELINTGQPAILCNLSFCEPGVPYKVDAERDTVAFLTYEQDQGPTGTDLDGDGNAFDIVLTVFNVRTRQRAGRSCARSDSCRGRTERPGGSSPGRRAAASGRGRSRRGGPPPPWAPPRDRRPRRGPSARPAPSGRRSRRRPTP